jgi:FixJ family two-component response regulator
MDLQMPEMNGVEATAAIRAEFPDARIIVLTTYTGDVQVALALKAGASGYLLKNGIRKELLATIRAVHAGRKVLSPEIAFAVANRAADETLSPSETRVLRLIADGLSNKEIAAKLSVTEEAKGQVNILSAVPATDPWRDGDQKQYRTRGLVQGHKWRRMLSAVVTIWRHSGTKPVAASSRPVLPSG